MLQIAARDAHARQPTRRQYCTRRVCAGERAYARALGATCACSLASHHPRVNVPKWLQLQNDHQPGARESREQSRAEPCPMFNALPVRQALHAHARVQTGRRRPGCRRRCVSKGGCRSQPVRVTLGQRNGLWDLGRPSSTAGVTEQTLSHAAPVPPARVLTSGHPHLLTC